MSRKQASVSKRLKIFFLKKLALSKLKGKPIDIDEISREFVTKEYRREHGRKKSNT